jgi:choline dehydrogenase-like flavoprotein
MWGCVEGAKGSVDLTHWPQNIKAGVKLITGARVRRLNVAPNGLVTGAEYVDREGSVHFQKASVTVLGASGIGTPRILLLSDSAKSPNGLANSSGMVGRRLMMHPFGTVVGLFDEDMQSTHGLWGQHIHSLQFYETDPARGFVRGAKWGLQPTGGPLSMTRGYPWGDNPIWGTNFHKNFRERFARSAMWGIICEDLPEIENRVVLDPVLKDSDGIPAPKLLYRMSENSKRLLQFHLARARESLEAAGARQVVTAPLIRETGWHLLGTTVMGNDPSSSVVNAWGQAHDVRTFIFSTGVSGQLPVE